MSGPEQPMSDIVQITPVLNSFVTADLVDANGHMSLPHYVTVAARAVWTRKLSLGLEHAWDEGLTFFVTEQHARYVGELVLDDRFTAHPRFVARSARALHTVTHIVDATREKLACSIESVSVFVSMQARSSFDIIPELAANLDLAIAQDRTLPPDGHVTCPGLWR